MAVRPRGGSWQADITVKGQRYRETFDSEAEAKAWELNARAAAVKGEPIPRPIAPSKGTDAPRGQSREDGALTLSAVMWKAYDKFWKGGRSDAKAAVNIRQAEAYFGKDCPVSRIDTDAIDGFVADCIAKRNSNGTVNRKLAILSKSLRYAFDRGLIPKMPKIDRKSEGVGRFRWLDEDEEKALLDTFRSWGKDDHAEVIETLIDTGMRPSELYRLTPRDVDLKTGAIMIWMTKTDNPRTVYATKRVKAILQRRIGAVTAPTEKLFPYDNFWMRHTWDRARLHLGMENDPHFVPYICRHTCASRLVQRGVPINVVKEWLGHTSIQMTMRYAFLAPKNLMSAASVLEAAE
ncbi:tyrosine-type recombinase/integrase [Azorhizobium caulinodans]|nr:site-specific integrase [Azorhizobium caulinodans]